MRFRGLLPDAVTTTYITTTISVFTQHLTDWFVALFEPRDGNLKSRRNARVPILAASVLLFYMLGAVTSGVLVTNLHFFVLFLPLIALIAVIRIVFVWMLPYEML